MKITAFTPVKNEAQFAGYSIMSVLPYVHEFILACAPSTDGTDELLDYIKEKYAKDKLIILRKPEYDFNVHDMKAYNKTYNDCIAAATGDALWFLHMDMVTTNPEKILSIKKGPLAWWTNLTCYAGDLRTKITTGRRYQWKNISVNDFGVHYYGEYGSDNEDMYFSDITGKSYRQHQGNFKAYPYEVADSRIHVNHYCELKPYARRLEKMKACLKTLYPNHPESVRTSVAEKHPRVTLEPHPQFDKFTFEKTDEPVPEIILRHHEEFDQVVRGKLDEGFGSLALEK